MPSSEPKAMRMMIGGGDEADGLAVGRRRLRGLLDGLAADLHLQAVRAAALHEVDDVLHVGLGELTAPAW